MRNIEHYKDSFITSYGEVINPCDEITLHFMCVPGDMYLPWTLVHARESDDTKTVAVTVKSANGVVRTFHDDGVYDISGKRLKHNFNLFLKSPLTHCAEAILKQMRTGGL